MGDDRVANGVWPAGGGDDAVSSSPPTPASDGYGLLATSARNRTVGLSILAA